MNSRTFLYPCHGTKEALLDPPASPLSPSSSVAVAPLTDSGQDFSFLKTTNSSFKEQKLPAAAASQSYQLTAHVVPSMRSIQYSLQLNINLSF